MFTLWDKLKTDEEKRALLELLPAGWLPFSALPELESLHEIERIMKERPQGSLGALGPGMGHHAVP